MIILLITVPLPPAVAFPSSRRGPGFPMAGGAGERRGAAGTGWLCAWCTGAARQHSCAAGRFGARRSWQGLWPLSGNGPLHLQYFISSGARDAVFMLP